MNVLNTRYTIPLTYKQYKLKKSWVIQNLYINTEIVSLFMRTQFVFIKSQLYLVINLNVKLKKTQINVIF